MNTANSNITATDRTGKGSSHSHHHSRTRVSSTRTGKIHVRTVSTSEKIEVLRKRAERRQHLIDADRAVYNKELLTQRNCARNYGENCAVVPARIAATGIEVHGTLVGGRASKRRATPPVTLTADEVAYIAFARLKLTAPTPMVGPPPSTNKRHMAAVGYPLWLWVAGDTDPAPVSDAVGGLFVSLDAHLSKVVFSMGDGTKVTCNGKGTAWGSWVKPGQKSPTCGHTYAKPSLPKGNYTVTATTYWSVVWNVSGQTGAIPYVQSAQTTLPVGELQVLVR